MRGTAPVPQFSVSHYYTKQPSNSSVLILEIQPRFEVRNRLKLGYHVHIHSYMIGVLNPGSRQAPPDLGSPAYLPNHRVRWL